MRDRYQKGSVHSAYPRSVDGYSLIEVTVTMAISSLLLVSLGGVVMNALAVNDESRARNDIARDARFALQRMVDHVQDSRRLLVPMPNSSKTAQDESTFDPGVLAMTISPLLDRDANGIADADNDGDGLVDEDLGSDASNDGEPGLIGIDDNNDLLTDSSFGGAGDDDESGIFRDEDPVNGVDDDGDGSIDEDASGDMNGDGLPGNKEDDDEDGEINEDWLDAVVYYLLGTSLIERFPNLNASDGTDFTERAIAENVTTFRVQLLERGINRVDVVRITLGFDAGGQSVLITHHARVGGPP